MTEYNFELGLTTTFPCSYLPDQEERLLIAVDERLQNAACYTSLMAQGFRRSADQAYRPHCPNCNACQSIRVLAKHFKPTKSQKRSLKKNSALVIRTSDNLKEEYYPLYENYINTLHQDGTMYPATKPQFESFLSTKLTQQLFIETWDVTDGNETLICVAVTDKLDNALSAVYTFYHPEKRKQGLGVFSILSQIQLCQNLDIDFLYLGYQIDNCKKMNYKTRYFPHERYISGNWVICTSPALPSNT
ncbi:MAG: arginyltransferase [Colwellia sp.]